MSDNTAAIPPEIASTQGGFSKETQPPPSPFILALAKGKVRFTIGFSSNTFCSVGLFFLFPFFFKETQPTLHCGQHHLLLCHQAEYAETSPDVRACLKVSADDVSYVRVAHFDGHHTSHSFNGHDSFVNLHRQL